MTRNPANLALEDQFLLWCQELEARQEEQARQVAELHEQANRLREENERLRTQLEAGWAEQSREPPRLFPPSRPSKGKEVAVSDDIDLPTDDELSSCSSPLPRCSPSPNAAEDNSQKRSPRRSSRSVSIARCQMRREPSRDQRPPQASSPICARPNWGSPPASTKHVPAFQSHPRTANNFCLRRSGTTEDAFHSPWIAYPGL